jgi:hypothetical protein
MHPGRQEKKMLRGILNDLLDMDEASLRELNHACVSQLKAIRNRKSALNRHVFKAGDRVSFSGRAGLTEGTIVRVKRKKAIVSVDTGGRPGNWDVPLGMLSAA